VRFGLKTNQHHLTWPELLGRVRFAEEHGFHNAWIFDHLQPMGGDPRGPCLEAWSLLAALAASTERIRIGAMVTSVMFRHPSVLAAQAVTVDHVSGGRLDVAIGAGSVEAEHRELGIEFPSARDRAERLEETVRLMRQLMTEDDASFEGRHYGLHGATYRPRPVQRPHPPIWIGAGGDRLTIPVAARVADVWHAFDEPEDLPHKLEVLVRAAEDAGRDPAGIRKATNLPIDDDWDVVVDRAHTLRGLGFDDLVVPWPSGGEDRVEEFAHRVMPRLLGAASVA
jgi:F420-dependent oxidoreductase-like protein